MLADFLWLHILLNILWDGGLNAVNGREMHGVRHWQRRLGREVELPLQLLVCVVCVARRESLLLLRCHPKHPSLHLLVGDVLPQVDLLTLLIP